MPPLLTPLVRAVGLSEFPPTSNADRCFFSLQLRPELETRNFKRPRDLRPPQLSAATVASFPAREVPLIAWRDQAGGSNSRKYDVTVLVWPLMSTI